MPSLLNMKTIEPGWISTAKELPGVRARVKVRSRVGIVFTCWYDPETKTFSAVDTDQELVNVTHWRFY